MKETIERIIKKIHSEFPASTIDYKRKINAIIQEELSTFNPMKIDEERFKNIYNKTGARGFEASFSQDAVKEYNSTLEDHQVLQPLPDEMPDEFKLNYSLMTAPYTWNWLVKTYSSPTKKELVSVDELEKEFLSIVRSLPLVGGAFHISLLAQHIIDTYSLNPPKREWWMDLKKSDKFMFNGKVKFLHHINDRPELHTEEGGVVYADQCAPYIEPTIFDRLKAKGVTDDEINELINQHEKQEFMKEVKG